MLDHGVDVTGIEVGLKSGIAAMDIYQIVNHLGTLSLFLRLTFILIRRIITVGCRHWQNWIFLENYTIMEEGKNVLVAIDFMELDIE